MKRTKFLGAFIATLFISISAFGQEGKLSTKTPLPVTVNICSYMSSLATVTFKWEPETVILPDGTSITTAVPNQVYYVGLRGFIDGPYCGQLVNNVSRTKAFTVEVTLNYEPYYKYTQTFTLPHPVEIVIDL
ncbi:MAG: hypothetical protein LBP67_10890 [Bacteroidales bacterium]|jgi:hypothetical protein|nr:hypothetical protein [Bacteroidales bacterium]